MLIDIGQKLDTEFMKKVEENGLEFANSIYKIDYKLASDVRNDNFWTTDDTTRSTKEDHLSRFIPVSPENSKVGVFSYSQVLYGMEFSTEIKHFFTRELRSYSG